MSPRATKPTGPRLVPLAGAVVVLVGAGIFIGTLIRPVGTSSGTSPGTSPGSSPVLSPGPPPHASLTPRLPPGASPNAAPARAPVQPAVSKPAVVPGADRPGTPPSFDVVRVDPGGSAVIAGRAFPGSHVTVKDGAHVVGQAQANAEGTWVIIPAAPLSPGSHNLTVAAAPPQGGAAVVGNGSVVIAVGPHTGTPQAPLAVATGPDVSRVLQGGGTAKPGVLGLQTLDYDEHGHVRLSGTAPPHAEVRVYAGNKLLGRASAGADGRWTLDPHTALTPGRHSLRLDQLGRGNHVIHRLELPFRQENFAGRALPPGSAVVQPGQSLWRIAQARYGAGTEYTLIFGANRAEIRNPNLIYPGQAFAVPGHTASHKAPHSLEARGASGR